MKRILALVLITALLLTMGCAAKSSQTQTAAPAKAAASAGTERSTAAASAAASGATSAAVSEVESDLDSLGDIDEEFLDAELEDLDSELDFEI